jgi:hypothetical protein
MHSQLSKLTDVLFPGIFVAALSVVGYYSTRPALTSARPDSSTPAYVGKAPIAPPGMATMHARIWEDPLLPYREPTTKPDDKEEVKESEPASPADVLESRVRDATDFTCLAVLVPGGPDEESYEQRLRMRYAVVSALGQSGFSLKYNSRLTYADLKDISVTASSTKSNSFTTSTKVRIPLKLYSRNIAHSGQAPEHVLVCWIDEQVLGDRPLDTLQQIMDKLFPSRDMRSKKVKLRILGPTSSDMLDSIWHNDRKQWSHWGTEPPQLWCTRATRYDERDAQDLAHRTGITFHRAIGTDDELQDALRWELFLRNAWPKPKTQEKIVLVTEMDTSYGRAWTHAGRPFQSKCAGKEPCPEDRMDLTVETGWRGPVDVKLPQLLNSDQLLVFSYLRGIDGRTFHASSKKEGSDKDKGREGASSGRLVVPSATEPQTGSAQLDYLRRLERELTSREDSQSIKAIGIIGTDVYDKLLILRALRPHFPNAVFFTTDLDVELWHPDEMAWTRNLVVASHYGLTLNSDGLKPPAKSNTGHTPPADCDSEATDTAKTSPSTVNHPTPFRDSYQTALFYAVSQAVATKASNFPKTATGSTSVAGKNPSQGSSPANNTVGYQEQEFRNGCLLFEIGTSGPFQLANINAPPDRHPPTSHSRLSLFRTVGVIFVFLLLLAVPYWAGIRFIVDFVELFKRAWNPPDGPLAQIGNLIKHAWNGFSRRSRLIHSLWHWFSAVIFVSVCGAILIQYVSWLATLVILTVLVALIAFAVAIVGAHPTVRWDVYFFAFAGVSVAILLVVRSPREPGDTLPSWVMGSGVGLALLVGMAVFTPVRDRGKAFGKQLNAALHANILGRRSRRTPQLREAIRDADKVTPYWIIVVATVVGLAAVALMIIDQFMVAGEPFTAAGVSMWPVTLARAFLFLAACIFIVTCIASLAKNAAKLKWECLGPLAASAMLPPVWRKFFGRRFLKAPTHPAMPMVWAFFFGSMLFFSLTSYPSNPSRGPICFMTSQAVMLCTVISMALLSFVVYEAVQSVRACVKRLRGLLEKENPVCPDSMLAGQAAKWHVSLLGDLRPAIEGLTIVGLLAERTRIVGRLLLLPAWIVLGTALIRLSWLDNLGVSWQLLLVLSVLVVFPLVFYARLRLEVHRVREQVNDKLQRLKSALTGEDKAKELRQLAILNDAINAESRGAFAPLARDPIFQALSIPFGGAGGVMLIQDIMSHF